MRSTLLLMVSLAVVGCGPTPQEVMGYCRMYSPDYAACLRYFSDQEAARTNAAIGLGAVSNQLGARSAPRPAFNQPVITNCQRYGDFLNCTSR